MDKSREILDKIITIPRKIERKLDDLLPDIYSYIANYSENYIYDNRLPIDTYELKDMINRSFSTINNNFLLELDYTINEYINILTRKIENNENIEQDLLYIEDDLRAEIQSVLKQEIEKGISIFEDEYYIQYTRRLQSEETIYLGKLLTRKLEDEMPSIIKPINMEVTNFFEEAIEQYQISKRNNKPNELEKIIDDIYEQYKTEIEATVSAKMAFLDFEYFCRDLISRGITPSNINEYDSRQLENLIKILREQIQKNHEIIQNTQNQQKKENSQDKEERQSKPKHMREVSDVEISSKKDHTPKHFKVQQSEITQEQIDQITRSIR